MKKLIVIALMFLIYSCDDSTQLINLDKEAFSTIVGRWRIDKIINCCPTDTTYPNNAILIFNGGEYSPNKDYDGNYEYLGTNSKFKFNVYNTGSTNAMSIGECEPKDSLKLGIGTYKMIKISDTEINVLRENNKLKLVLKKM